MRPAYFVATVCVTVAVLPAESVTVNRTTNVFTVAKMCDGFWTLAVLLSPKSHTQLVIVAPVEAIDGVASKNTCCPAPGSLGENVNSATIWLEVFATVTLRVVAPCLPSLSVTVNDTVNVPDRLKLCVG